MDDPTKQFIVEQMQGLREDIAGVESRLGKRLGSVESNLENLTTKVSTLTSRIEDMDERLERVEQFSSDTYDIVSGRLHAVEGKVGIKYVAPQGVEE